MPSGLSRFIPRSRSNDRGYPPHASMDRILSRMIRVHEGRDRLERDFDHDVRRTPLWHMLNAHNQRNGVRDDFRRLYGALRSMGFEMGFAADREHPARDEGWLCELRYGHRIWTYRFSPMLMERSVDAQQHMIETICTGAQQLFMEVALDNVLDNDHSVMPHRRPMAGGNALRYEASQRITFEDLDRPLRQSNRPRTDMPGVTVDFTTLPDMRHRAPRTPSPPRVPPPTTAELRANAGADLEHLDVADDLLGDAPERTFGPSESALEESYRV